MSIRQAEQTDIAQIASLVSALASYYMEKPETELPLWFSETLTEAAFKERITHPEFVNFVYEEGDAIVGYISLKLPGHLYHLFVAEAFQGKGLSRLLWEHVQKHTGQSLFTVRSSLYAVPVYHRFGFIESDAVGVKDGISFQPMTLDMTN